MSEDGKISRRDFLKILGVGAGGGLAVYLGACGIELPDSSKASEAYKKLKSSGKVHTKEGMITDDEKLSTETPEQVDADAVIQSEEGSRPEGITDGIEVDLEARPLVFGGNPSHSIFAIEDVNTLFSGSEFKSFYDKNGKVVQELNDRGWVPYVDSRKNLSYEVISGKNRLCLIPKDRAFLDPENGEIIAALYSQEGVTVYGNYSSRDEKYKRFEAIPLNSDVTSYHTIVFAKKINTIDPDLQFPHLSGDSSLLLINRNTGAIIKEFQSLYKETDDIEYSMNDNNQVELKVNGENLSFRR